MTKCCTRCNTEKPVAEFRENVRYADGRVNWCNACASEYRAAHYQKNKAKAQAVNAAWHEANKEARNASARAAYVANPQAHCDRVKAAKARNPEHYRQMASVRAKRVRAERPEAAIRARISAQLNYCLSTGKGGKTSEALLGYPMTELRDHLQRQFVRGMSWQNMGEWHIDHIVPLASFTITGPADPELRRAWALPNLRPLWAAENIAKRDKRTCLL